MKSLIVGMGIGKLYQTVLSNLGHEVFTVDSDPGKGADFPNIESAIYAYAPFDTVHICTPNFTHFTLAKKLAKFANIIFVEKPGLENDQDWINLVLNYPSTRFMMVKNNQWRLNFPDIKNLINESETIKLHWINKNRVPNPGSWFTNKKLAFGGVSKDLLPHLLSFYTAIESDYTKSKWSTRKIEQRWKLNDMVDSDYGNVNQNGIYDVDDYVELETTINNRKWIFIADWRNTKINDIAIHTDKGSVELGLCPEEAYQSMIQNAIKNYTNKEFWTKQLLEDSWIHRTITFT